MLTWIWHLSIEHPVSRAHITYQLPFPGENKKLVVVGMCLDAASTARACSRVALKCNAARLSANTFELTPYMSLCL